MSSKISIFTGLLAILFLTPSGQAGCLEPQKILDHGSFTVESCEYHATTNAVYEDPRLQDIKGTDFHKNPASALGINKTKGQPKILSLAPENQGVLLKGKINNQSKQTTAFLRTKTDSTAKK